MPQSAKQTPSQIDQFEADCMEIASNRVTQAEAIINAIQCTHNDDEFELPDSYIQSALWGVQELLKQAQKAFDDVSDKRIQQIKIAG